MALNKGSKPAVKREVEEVVETAAVEEVVETAAVEEVVETAAVEEVVEEEVVETKQVAVGTGQTLAQKDDRAGDVVSRSEEQGFYGLDFTDMYGMFPTLVIGTGGTFELDKKDMEFKEIVCKLQGQYPLYGHSQDGVKESAYAFSLDGKNLVGAPPEGAEDCKTVEQLAQLWKDEEDCVLVTKKYFTIVCEVVECGDSEMVGEFIICKIPPSSLKTWQRIPFLADLRKIPLQGMKVKFALGERRTNKSGDKYTPWECKFVK